MLLVCSTHGARFRVKDGFCVEGPCAGASLEKAAIGIENGGIFAAPRENPEP